ncbi:MAG TPA: hypothetical protein EYG73_06900 [Arcobacter sp.]|nr:hypothetical protein [Arcobacter sp.]
MNELKDIKAIESISIDFSAYFIFIALCILCIVVLIIFLKTRKKRLTKSQKASRYLKALDFDTYDDKTLAYNFTIYGHECLQSHYEDEFLKIIRQLEQYKYKKDIQKIDSELIEEMKDYIKVRV